LPVDRQHFGRGNGRGSRVTFTRQSAGSGDVDIGVFANLSDDSIPETTRDVSGCGAVSARVLESEHVREDVIFYETIGDVCSVGSPVSDRDVVKRDLVVAGLEPSPQCDGSGQTGVVQHLVRVVKKTELVAKDSLGESAVVFVATERLRAVSSWEVSLRQG